MAAHLRLTKLRTERYFMTSQVSTPLEATRKTVY